MKKTTGLGIAAVLFVMAVGCGTKVMVPPRIDLKQHEVVGIIEFRCSSQGELGPLATRKFTEMARRDQGMVRILGLGSEVDVRNAVGHNRIDQATFKALGEAYDVSTIITGEIVVSDVRPSITITPGMDYAGFSAEVAATLSVQMVETSTGASIWSGSASETQEIAHISILRGKDLAFDADDPERAYGRLVDGLVYKVTKDFRATWERK